MDKTPHTSNPLVSVIISTYNRANLLGRAIKSVLNQTYPHFELVIVDAASIDGTSKIVNAFTDNRIKYLKFEKRIRKSKAINEALGVTKGIYLTILDDDDELFPQALQLEVDAIQNTPDPVGFIFGMAKVYRNGKITAFPRRIYPTKLDFYKAQLHSTALSLWGVLIKKDCFKTVGLLNEELILGEDWEFMLRLMKHYDYKYIKSPIYKANYHDPSNISHISLDLIKNYSERIRSYKIVLRAHLSEIQNFKPILAKFYFRIARNLFNLGKLRLAGKFFRLTLLTNPLNFRSLLWLFIVKVSKNNPERYQTSQGLLTLFENSDFPLLKRLFF